MHIHGNLVNPNLALDAAYAAQQAQAKREAEATRKELFKSAMTLAAENGDYVVSIGGQRENPAKQSKQNQWEKKKQKADAEQEDVNAHISDWA
jgi:hypothetical protein